MMMMMQSDRQCLNLFSTCPEPALYVSFSVPATSDEVSGTKSGQKAAGAFGAEKGGQKYVFRLWRKRILRIISSNVLYVA